VTSSGFRLRPDSVLLSVQGREGHLHTDAFDQLVEALTAIDAAPEWIRNGKKRRFSRSALHSLLRGAAGAPELIVSLERQSPVMGIQLAIYPGASDGRGFAMTSRVPWSLLAPVDRATAFAERIGPALASFQILFGNAHSLADVVEMHERDSDEWEPSTIDEVYWLNWWGSSLVARFGRERVLSTPAHMLRELPDGSVLWTTSPSPADSASDGGRIAQARARAHLVDGVSFEAELARLRSRSERLAPAEPRWDGELDPLFARIANTDPPEQFQLVRKLNALEIPPVTEWRPAADVTPNVDAPDAAEEYGLHAEQLIALLHDRVPDIDKLTVEALPELDAHVWRARLAETTPRDVVDRDLVPAIGGYLGDLLVRRFQGRWVPRKDLDEAAVIIGDRAWLPFARARKHLATRNGALTHSLTQFISAVERGTVK
jgi:hypothetical protein